MSTEHPQRRVKALSLLSGGLDSALAVCVLRDQGVEVHAIIFASPFFDPQRGIAAATELNVSYTVVDFTAEILGLIRKPKHGFGAGMNPCIDCHAAMIRKAAGLMKELGADFISTGEVLNQRPMSQTRRSLGIVAEESGCADLLLRPLSAAHTPETEPERRRWVDRSRLLAIEGRSRRVQLEMAKRYGLTQCLAGTSGCRLTEPNFARRLRDLKKHEGADDPRLIGLLRLGRHFRLQGGARLIVGRNQKDNADIEAAAAPGDLILSPSNSPGPTALLLSGAGEAQIQTAAAVCARYSDGPLDQPVRISVRSSAGARTMDMTRANASLIEALRIASS